MRKPLFSTFAAVLLALAWLGCSSSSDPAGTAGAADTECPDHEPANGHACATDDGCAYAGGDLVDICAPVSIIDSCNCDHGEWTCLSEDHACGDHSGDIGRDGGRDGGASTHEDGGSVDASADVGPDAEMDADVDAADGF